MRALGTFVFPWRFWPFLRRVNHDDEDCSSSVLLNDLGFSSENPLSVEVGVARVDHLGALNPEWVVQFYSLIYYVAALS